MERNFPISVEKVWESITVLDKIKQWFFEQIENFEPVVGFKTSFLVKSENRFFPHQWQITEVEPKTKITYNWKYYGIKGDSYVTFEIKSVPSGTNLQITNKIVEDFPDDFPEFTRESCIAGWNYFFDRLNIYLLKD